jgi:hypothetical protein
MSQEGQNMSGRQKAIRYIISCFICSSVLLLLFSLEAFSQQIGKPALGGQPHVITVAAGKTADVLIKADGGASLG